MVFSIAPWYKKCRTHYFCTLFRKKWPAPKTWVSNVYFSNDFIAEEEEEVYITSSPANALKFLIQVCWPVSSSSVAVETHVLRFVPQSFQLSCPCFCFLNTPTLSCFLLFCRTIQMFLFLHLKLHPRFQGDHQGDSCKLTQAKKVYSS